MKNRIFYVIHLDTERILILIFIFFLFISISFFIGLKIGRMTNINTEITLPSPVITESKEKEMKLIEEKNLTKERDQINQRTIPLDELKKSENETLLSSEKKLEETKALENKTVNKEQNYTIQIGAYKNKEEANLVFSKLKKNGIESYLQKKNKYYVIYAKANSTQELNITKKELQKLNIKDVIIYKNK